LQFYIKYIGKIERVRVRLLLSTTSVL